MVFPFFYPFTVEKFALDIAEKGVYVPINVIWMNDIMNGKLDSADGIRKKYLNETPKIMFNHLLKVARDRKEKQIIKKLLVALKDSKVSEGGLGTIHSCIIDVYSAQEKYDDALRAVKDVCLENLNRTALFRVKEGLEAAVSTQNSG